MVDEVIDPYTALLGAFALDAIDGEEREAVELHLLECPRCRAEVAEHREVASFLSQTGAPAPEGVWDRIVAELSPEAPPLRLAMVPVDDGVSSSGVVTPLAPRSSRVRRRTFAAALSAAAVIVALLGVSVRQYVKIDRMQSSVQSVSPERRALDVMSGSGLQVHLNGRYGTAQAVVSDRGEGYLIAKNLPAPKSGTVYQLWGQINDRVLSLGTFDGRSRVVPFSVDGKRMKQIQSFSVTEELAPGVTASANPPVVAGTV
jgi:hypothetical protein